MANLLGMSDATQANVGTGFSAAGDLLGGAMSYIGGQAAAASDSASATRVKYRTDVQLAQQQRKGEQVQGSAETNIGANGGTFGGSSADILRSNAQQLSLEHGMIQSQGSEQEASALAAAKAAKSAGMGGLIKGVVEAAGVIAAPFTGGASLALTAAAAAG